MSYVLLGESRQSTPLQSPSKLPLTPPDLSSTTASSSRFPMSPPRPRSRHRSPPEAVSPPHRRFPMPRPLIIAMKGHPGSGKSTLARRISASLRCPLLDKDDVRDHTLPLQQTLMVPPALLNDLAYAVLFRLAESQLASAGLPAVVVDSPLSSRGHLDRLLEVARRVGGGVAVAVVECRPGDEDEWRRRLEERGRWTEEEGEKRGWHKPKTWEELRRLVDGYGGRTDYDVGGVPRLVVDTTAPMTDGKDGSDEMMSEIMEFIRSIRDVETEVNS